MTWNSKENFTITSQDPQDWEFVMISVAFNDKSIFTNICRSTMVWFLLMSRAHGIV